MVGSLHFILLLFAPLLVVSQSHQGLELAQWTNNYTVPCNLDNGLSHAMATVMDGKIWIICENVVPPNIITPFYTRWFVFDPITELFTEIGNQPRLLLTPHFLAIFADGNDLYALRGPLFQSFPINRILYKLNKVTSNWDSIMSIPSTFPLRSVVALDGMLYILEWREDRFVTLTVVDLEDERNIGWMSLHNPSSSWTGFLSTYENRVMLVEAYDNNRTVSEFKNETLVKIHSEQPAYADPLYEKPVQSTDSLEYVHININSNFETRVFDFDSHTWQTNVTHPDWSVPKTAIALYSVMKINESIYTLVKQNTGGVLKLHKLDLGV